MIGRTAPRCFPYVTEEDNHLRVFHIETTTCFEPECHNVSSQFEGQLSCPLMELLLHGKLHTKETPVLGTSKREYKSEGIFLAKNNLFHDVNLRAYFFDVYLAIVFPSISASIPYPLSIKPKQARPMI